MGFKLAYIEAASDKIDCGEFYRKNFAAMPIPRIVSSDGGVGFV